MGSLLSGLTKLQSVENRLRAAKAKLTRCRRSVILQENKIRSEQNALEAKKEEVQLTFNFHIYVLDVLNTTYICYII